VIADIIRHRALADSFFRYDPASPFRNDTTIRFDGLKWFPPDLRFYFRSPLYRYEHPETVIVYGTKGEPRQEINYGYFLIPFSGAEYRLNTYKSARSGIGLSVRFTDETTGKETYHVGRYVEVGEEQPRADAMYTIDLNSAYNPYCAYSARYSCAIPRKDDHFPFRVTAGELKYQD
jgi:uncharacterized protein (DUF1684 family)